MINIDKLWLWAQTEGGHHRGEVYNLPGVNKMGPHEGAKFFGIKNICLVKTSIDGELSVSESTKRGEDCEKIVMSITGAGGCEFQSDGQNDLEEVIEAAHSNPKIVAGVMDDLIGEARLKQYPAQKLAEIHERMNKKGLEFWSVTYEYNLELDIEERLRQFDVTTFWTWIGEELPKLEENLKRIKEKADTDRVMLGVYMWNYGEKKPLHEDLMRYQLDFVRDKLEKNEIEGMILCSNCIADIGLSTVDMTREWIIQNFK